MATIADQILNALSQAGPLDDDDLAQRLGLRRQSVNPVANRLAEAGRTRRYTGASGKWVNALPGDDRIVERVPPVERGDGRLVTEDDVKSAVRDHLHAAGYEVKVAWGRLRGIDIEAHHSARPRLVIEAKGEVVSDQQQGNYFLGALGELLQRMDDDGTVYALALPDNRRYRGLVARLPSLARQRLGLRLYWVSRTPLGLSVEEEG